MTFFIFKNGYYFGQSETESGA